VSCRALEVPGSWFYKWRRGDASPRRARRERLKAEVRRLFEAHKGKRGSPMITADLHDAGWRVSKNTVAALMAEMGLAARPKKRRRATTRPGKGRWRAPDLVKRDFPAAGINVKWYGDGTDIDTDEGKLYLDSVLDVGSRRVLGFALGEHHDAELACGALVMAVAVRHQQPRRAADIPQALAQGHGQDEDHPQPHHVGHRQQPQHQRKHAQNGLGSHQEVALARAVGDQAAIWSQQQHRQELRRGDQAE